MLPFRKFSIKKPNKFKKTNEGLPAGTSDDSLSQGLLSHQNETASSFDSGSYADGDDGIAGGIFRRNAKVATPLTKEVDEDLGGDPGMYSYFGYRGANSYGKQSLEAEEITTKTPDAVYSYMELTDESAQALYKWSQKAGIPNPVTPDKYHSTVVYSTVPFTGYTLHKQPFSIDPSTYAFDVLIDALVLKFTSKIAKSQWEKAKKIGAKYTFSEYTPHITLSYDPENFDYSKIALPTFAIHFKTEHLQVMGKEVTEEETLDSKFQDAIEKVKGWIKSGAHRKSMTHLARLTKKAEFKKFHPGEVTVYRGKNDDSVDHTEVGASWTKSKEVAKDYAGPDGEVIQKKLTVSTPALDINKLLNKTLRDKEVFITHRT